jgi:hypothetical protein
MWAILAPLCLLIIVAALNTSPHTPPQAAPAAAFRGDR